MRLLFMAIRIIIRFHAKLRRIPVLNPLEDQDKAKQGSDNDACACKQNEATLVA